MSQPSISLVVPVFNEANRIRQCLEQAIPYLESRGHTYELIIADDGSTDQTLAIADEFTASNPRVKVLRLPHRGKAATVRAGVLSAKGLVIGFTDVDLATPLRFLEVLAAELSNGAGVAIASREGTGAQRVGEPFHRHAMGRVFNLFVRVLVLPRIHDTQCGFKFFHGDIAQAIFTRSLLYGDDQPTLAGARVTAFDVEILVIARRLGHRIAIVPVEWHAGTDSKVNPFRDAWHNAVDVLKVWRFDRSGRYSE